LFHGDTIIEKKEHPRTKDALKMKTKEIEKIKAHYLTMIAEKNFDHFINPNIIQLVEGEAEIHWQPTHEHLNRFGAVRKPSDLENWPFLAFSQIFSGKKITIVDINPKTVSTRDLYGYNLPSK
jgi:hypothetical protein